MESEKSELANQINELNDQINELKNQITEIENKKLSDEATSNIARDKANKKIWDEMAKKDSRIEELERWIDDIC